MIPCGIWLVEVSTIRETERSENDEFANGERGFLPRFRGRRPIKWWKKIAQQIFKSRCKSATSVCERSSKSDYQKNLYQEEFETKS